jgi:hypothetical protein
VSTTPPTGIGPTSRSVVMPRSSFASRFCDFQVASSCSALLRAAATRRSRSSRRLTSSFTWANGFEPTELVLGSKYE